MLVSKERNLQKRAKILICIVLLVFTLGTAVELIQSQSVSAVSESEQTKFIKSIASDAKKYGNNNDLYPSVIIAQAALESAYGTSELAVKGNNIFGIKGTYGSVPPVIITSNEANGDKIVSLKSEFKSYPSITVGMQDYVDKIVLGPGVFRDKGDFDSWNPILYSAAWRSNAKTYADATLALEASGYSGDKKGIIYPNGQASIGYSEKLNNLIKKHDLTQYDTLVELFVPKVTATPVLNAYDYGVWNDYKSSNKRVAGLSQYVGKEIKVVKEATSPIGAKWVQFAVNGKTVGWVAKAGIRYVEIPKNVTKTGFPVSNAYDFGVWNDYESGNKRVVGLSEYTGKQITITKEVVATTGVKWVQFSDSGKVVGWVAQNGVHYGEIPQVVSKLSTPAANAYDFGVWNDYESGNTRVTGLSDFVGKQLEVIKEVRSSNGVKWVQFSADGQVIGWVAETGVRYGEIPREVSKLGTPVSNAYDFGVWNDYEAGNTRVAGLSEFAGKQLEVIKEVSSSNGVKWVQFSADGQVIGWVAETGMQYGEIPQTVSKLGTPVANAYDFGVWNDYEAGNTRIAGLSEFTGKQLEVIKEVVSLSGVKWIQFSADGQVIGWVAETGIQYGEIPQTVSKLGTPAANAYDFGIWNGYEAGNTRVAGLSEFSGKQLEVIKEVVSLSEVKWVQFSADDQVIGWVAETGIQYGEIPQTVSKLGTPAANAYDFGVWNDYEQNRERIMSLSEFSDQQIEITKEAESSLGEKLVQISQNGEEIGWVAETGIQYGEIPQTVSKQGTPAANASDFGIWNDYKAGNTQVRGLSEFVGKQLEVIKEITPSNGVKWVQISSEDQIIGWVAQEGISINQ